MPQGSSHIRRKAKLSPELNRRKLLIRVWEKQVAGCIEFLERLKATPVSMHGAVWVERMRGHYGAKATALLTDPPDGAEGKAVAYLRRLNRV